MDIGKLILTEAVPPPATLDGVDKAANLMTDERKKQAAKDFESVFVHKLLDTMKNTVDVFGSEKDSGAKQIDGIFWLYMARDIASNGGLGLWQDIYKFLTDSPETIAAMKQTQSLDANL